MKTIIVYTSKYGCTEKAALLLKSKMGGDADVVKLSRTQEPEIRGYDTVILGGSIYYGKIQKEMTAFVDKKKSELAGKRLGLFVCAGMKGDQAAQELHTAFPVELLIHAEATEVFGDEYDFRKMTLMDKVILRAVKGKELSPGLHMDAIDRFAQIMKNGVPQL
ncbi:flavodoxin domain-containing protein [Paenibacillus sp. sgz500958]|uniref:flavodoxin domain-containing protein n=1 Tax=Paenibacillus sp. sgz500958 TaxID=3242475 RepID=UPI0036D42B2D